MKTKHTPTPWHLTGQDLHLIVSGGGELLSQVAKIFSARDAAFIVIAVNNHYALLEALEHITSLVASSAPREKLLVAAGEALSVIVKAK